MIDPRQREERNDRLSSRQRQIFGPIIGAAFGLVVLVGANTVAYFATAWIYQRFDLHPDAWQTQVINLLAGIMLLFFVMGTIFSIAQQRGFSPEMKSFQPVLKAIQQIARGDFNIKLDNTFGNHEPLGTLVESVNTMAVELGRMEQLRQEFISDVSHEIQSPLTSIHGFAQALQNEQLSPEQRANYLAIIMNESMRLGRITDNLLRLAALEADGAKFAPREYRLDKQIRDLILACEPQWAAKGIDMDVVLANVVISADDDLLSQVWINLLSNSIKFTPAGGRVSVTLQQRDSGIEFRIADTGIGIAAADQPRLFERFYKADKARTQPNGGSGLGLSIAQKIVEMHDGMIKVESVPGAGTIFTVTLPSAGPAIMPPESSAKIASTEYRIPSTSH